MLSLTYTYTSHVYTHIFMCICTYIYISLCTCIRTMYSFFNITSIILLGISEFIIELKSKSIIFSLYHILRSLKRIPIYWMLIPLFLLKRVRLNLICDLSVISVLIKIQIFHPFCLKIHLFNSFRYMLSLLYFFKKPCVTHMKEVTAEKIVVVSYPTLQKFIFIILTLIF